MFKFFLSVIFVNFFSVPHCAVEYEYVNDDTFLKPLWDIFTLRYVPIAQCSGCLAANNLVSSQSSLANKNTSD